MAKKGPAFLCYPSDFITGTILMNAAQKGVYYSLVMAMYDLGKPLPDLAGDLSRICGCSPQAFAKIRDQLIAFGPEKVFRTADGRLSNARFERELKKQNRGDNAQDNAETIGGTNGRTNGGTIGGTNRPRSNENNDLQDDSRARAPAESARASSNSTSIAKQPGFAVGVDKALAGIIQRLPAAISREKRTEFRQQIWDFGLKDGIDPVLDLLPCVISDHDRNRIPTDIRTIGWWRRDALNRKREREARPPAEPTPELTDVDWTKALQHYLDTGGWRAPGPEPIADGCLAPSDLFDKAKRVWQANGNHPVHEYDSLANKVAWSGKGPMIYEATPFGKQQHQR